MRCTVRTLGRTRLLGAGSMRWLLASVLLGSVLQAPAQAHLMVAQKGTLNFHGDGAYMVLSVPVSAFHGVDDDGDQRLSSAELQVHAAGIQQQVQARAQLISDGEPLALQGLMLNLSPPDDAPDAPADQLVVMGRYALGIGSAGPQPSTMQFRLSLFGRAPAEQAYDITITRKPEAQAARYTPAQAVHAVLPAPARLFAEQLRLGVAHVLGGLDHVLFLLVVLASLAGAGAGWRQALGMLTCFTAGHALALAASARGLVRVSSSLVEPAIAASIVGMAAFDLWQRHRARWAPPIAQGALVTACAWVHGLGFAGALGHLGLSGWPLVWSVAGFNLGIELAQVGVAALAAWGVAVLTRWQGQHVAGRAAPAASMVGIVLGVGWLAARTPGFA